MLHEVCLYMFVGYFQQLYFQKVISFMAFLERCLHKILTWIHLIFTFLRKSCSIWSIFTSAEMLLFEAACRSFERPHAWVSIFKFSWQLLHSPEHAESKLLLKRVITSDDLAPAMWCQAMAIGSNVNKKTGKLEIAKWEITQRITCSGKHSHYC